MHDLTEQSDCNTHPQEGSSDARSGNSGELLHNGSDILDAELDAWILENLDDASVRSKRVDVLTASARPIQYSHAEVLMTIGNIYDRNVD